MRRIRLTVLCLALLLPTLQIRGAAESVPLDRRTALAGASLALADFYAAQDAADEVLDRTFGQICGSTEENETTDGETIASDAETAASLPESENDYIKEYEEPVTGYVAVDTLLNIREKPTTQAGLIGQLVRGDAVQVSGEAVVNGRLWYHVVLESGSGYAAGDYLLFGEEGENFVSQSGTETAEILTEPEIPSRFELLDRTDSLSAEEKEKLDTCIDEVNYCIASGYPEQKDAGNSMNMYSVLIYMIENYMTIQEISYEYGLQKTHTQVTADLEQVEKVREYLCYSTDQTDDDFVDQILEAQAQAAQEALEKAQAEAHAASYNLGVSIAQYAAGYIGVLPYVWGGASLTSGADCSGFVSQIMAHFGLIDQSLANCHGLDSTALRSVGVGVSLDEIQPGDIVCYNGHVAIYYGDGVVVHEPSPGKKCSWGNLYMANIICIRRLT